MNIQMSILSVFSAALLIMFCITGNEIVLDSLSADIYLSAQSVSIDIHPVWTVWTSQQFVFNCGAHAFAFGNVIVIGEHMRRRTYLEKYVIAHERMHIEQFRALGLLTWPAQFLINIEPDRNIVTNLSDPTQPERTMWKPPTWWPYTWSFITIRWEDT